MNRAVSSFFAKHSFVPHIDIDTVVDALLYDMRSGLAGLPSDEDMIPTWCNPPEKRITGRSVIVIDAGGTNFRSCLVTFDGQGQAQISSLEKTRMPGVEKELGRTEFFDQIAANLEHLKNKADCIGFCFSYPMQITEDGDGVLIGFSKEVKAPEVVGSRIGECLGQALERHGWNKLRRITLLNDTVAALLAGAALPDPGMRYSSYIGLILGTGLNSAYIQPAVEGRRKQIVVCESGKFGHVVRSDFDAEVDGATVRPGEFLMEKQCSGAYLGPLAAVVVRRAASEGLFTPALCKKLESVEKLTLMEADAFLHAPYCTDSVLGACCAECADDEDYDRMFQLLDALVERSARYTASMLIAAVIQSGEGRSAAAPVCILCNGTTFYKTYKIRDRVAGYLDEYLKRRRNRHYQLVSRDNDITLGSAIAGLTGAE